MLRHPYISTVFLFLVLAVSPDAPATPEVGDAAPDFELIGSDGKTWSLSDLKGERWTVVAFFPKAFTGG